MPKRTPETQPPSPLAVTFEEFMVSTGLPAFSVVLAGDRLGSLTVRRTPSGMVASLKLGHTRQYVSEWPYRNSPDTMRRAAELTARRVGELRKIEAAAA
jgi:hypothetical protein